MDIDGDRLRRARERGFLSQRELAEKAGVTYVTVWRIENGVTGPARPSTIRRLAAALGIDPAELVDWTNAEDGGDAKKLAA